MSQVEIWTVFEKPTDFPQDYVARRFVIQGGEPPWGTEEKIVSKSLDLIRASMQARGLILLPRDENDQPRILESWI